MSNSGHNKGSVKEILVDLDIDVIYQQFLKDYDGLSDSYRHDILDLARTEVEIRRIQFQSDAMEYGSQEWGRLQTALRGNREHCRKLMIKLQDALDGPGEARIGKRENAERRANDISTETEYGRRIKEINELGED